jgi:hypothetical protein
MKSSELRIGNFIASRKEFSDISTIGEVHSISSLDAQFEQLEVETDEDFTWFFKDNYCGIPLTEEWLLKFGFKLTEVDYYERFDCVIHLDINRIFIAHGEYPNSFESEIAIPKYVHQLQNLYFALTGTELTHP